MREYKLPNVPGLRSDPYTSFRFYITLIDSSSALRATLSAISAVSNYAIGGFSECSGLEMTLDVKDYKEGGVNEYVHKFVSSASYSNISLKKGMSLSDDLWIWHNDYIQGKGKRRDGLISLLNETGLPVKVWKFKRGIPLKWTGPSFNATQNSIAIETLEIAHEGIELLSPHAAVSKAM